MIKMNKVLRYALVFFPLLLLGCQKDMVDHPTEQFLISDVNELVFDRAGGTKEIIITAASSSAWSIDEAALEEWVTATREDNKVIVTVSESKLVEMRSTQLTINLPGSKFSFTISQFGTEPSIIILDGISEIKFDRVQDSRTIQIISNSPNWNVQAMGEIPWLKWEKNAEDNTLKLDVEAFRKDDPDSSKSRKGVIFISNDNQHLQLNIIQKGWLQFAEPFYMPLAHRSEIIAFETERGYDRNKDYEKRHYPQDEDVDKKFMAFSSDADQTPLVIYNLDVDNEHQIASGVVYLKAHEGATFVREDLNSWMEVNNYTETPRSDFWDQSQIRFYRAKDDVTCYFDVRNSEEKKFNGFDYKGAYMEYRESSNYLVLDDIKTGITSFPTRTAHKLHDVNFKIDDVIKYEASQGFEPDLYHELTKKSTDPNIRYFSLVFRPTSEKAEMGDLKMVVYVFNCPEAINYDKTLAEKLSHDAKLVGTVGQRQDVYIGNDYVYKKVPYYPEYPDWGSKMLIKGTFTSYAQFKGYVLGRTDSESGYTTYYRGKDELVDIYPIENGNNVVFEFYRNKGFVDNLTN